MTWNALLFPVDTLGNYKISGSTENWIEAVRIKPKYTVTTCVACATYLLWLYFQRSTQLLALSKCSVSLCWISKWVNRWLDGIPEVHREARSVKPVWGVGQDGSEVPFIRKPLFFSIKKGFRHRSAFVTCNMERVCVCVFSYASTCNNLKMIKSKLKSEIYILYSNL